MSVTPDNPRIVQVLGSTAQSGRPYAAGLVVRGDLIFVSGQTPMADGRLLDGAIEAQVDAVLQNIAAVLGEAGATLADVVRCGVFVADLRDLPLINAAYARAFAGHLPTRTTVGALLPGYGIEIDCVAVAPGVPPADEPAPRDRRPHETGQDYEVTGFEG